MSLASSVPLASAKPAAPITRVLFLLGLSVLINYIDRTNLSIAAPLLKDELHFTPAQLGWLLSAFFWTYATMVLVSGWLVDRFDVKWVFAAGFLLWSGVTAATGLMHSFTAFFVARIILGLGESVAFPSYGKIITRHLAPDRRGLANSLIAAGLCFGPATGLLFGGTLVSYFGWRPFFIALGLICLLWLVPWLAWMPPTPPLPPSAARVSFLDLLKNRSALGTFLGLFCGNYYLYFQVTWLPYYLTRELHFSLTQMARIGGLFFTIAAITSLIIGRISDHLIDSGHSPTIVLKSIMIAANIGMAACFAAAAFAPPRLAVACILLSGVAFGMSCQTVWAITQRLAGPAAVGRWYGLQLFFGNLAGVVAPALTGHLVGRYGNFRLPFLAVSAALTLGALIWIFLIGPLTETSWPSPAPALAPAD